MTQITPARCNHPLKNWQRSLLRNQLTIFRIALESSHFIFRSESTKNRLSHLILGVNDVMMSPFRLQNSVATSNENRSRQLFPYFMTGPKCRMTSRNPYVPYIEVNFRLGCNAIRKGKTSCRDIFSLPPFSLLFLFSEGRPSGLASARVKADWHLHSRPAHINYRIFLFFLSLFQLLTTTIWQRHYTS